MKSLVLGGCGFIGSHLVSALLDSGVKVRVLDKSGERYRNDLPGVEYFWGDWCDVALVEESLKDVDIVYHLISTTLPSTSNADPVYDVKSNLVPTLNLLNLMVKLEIPKIVFLSSGGTVYGVPDVSPVPEEHPLRPICSYGVVKVAIENYLDMYHKLYGLDYIVFRASNPFGERQGNLGVQGVIGTFIKRILEGKRIEIWGDGEIIRDFIYVGDFVDLCVKASFTKSTGIFNAGSGKGVSINYVIEILSDVSGYSIFPVYLPSRKYDIPKIILDNKKARNQFSWEPRTSFLQGMKLTWEWMVSLYN